MQISLILSAVNYLLNCCFWTKHVKYVTPWIESQGQLSADTSTLLIVYASALLISDLRYNIRRTIPEYLSDGLYLVDSNACY